MNFYNKINKYLVTHYPIAWNTGVVWLVAGGIFAHLLFYIIAYLGVTMPLLSTYQFDSFFVSNGFIYFYLLLLLIVGVLWLIKFYKNNPLKNFYIVQGNYLFAIFAHLFVIIFLFASVFFSFEAGKNAKARQLINGKELAAQKQVVNTAYAFYLSEASNYNIEERSYPKPFPLTNLLKKNIYSEVNSDNSTYDLNYKKPYTIFGTGYYQFGTTKEIKVSCITKTIIDSIYDVNKVYGLKEYSIYNFSTILVNGNLPSIDTNYSYASHVAPRIHYLMLTANKAAVVALLDSFSAICKQYQIINTTVNEEITTAALSNTSINNEGRIRVITTSPNFNYDNTYPTNYFDKSSLIELYSNYENAINKPFKWNDLLIVILIAMAISYVLVIGKFTTALNILLGFVFSGVIIIVGLLLAFLILFSIDNNSNNRILFFCATYSGFIVVISYLVANSTNVGLWWRSKFAVIAYLSFPTFAMFLLGCIYPSDNYVPAINCEPSTYTDPKFTPQLWHFIVIAMLTLIPAFIFVKKQIAKPE